MLMLAACGPGFRAPAENPGLLVADGSTLYGCEAGQPTEVLRWDGSRFVVVDAPTAAELQRCDDALAEVEERDPASTMWRVDDERVQRSSDGVTWNPVIVDSDLLYEPTFVETGTDGEVVVSHCRGEARRPDYYCYLEVSADEGETWVTLPDVGVFVADISQHGVLVGYPAIQPTGHSFTLQDFAGDTIVSIGVVPDAARVHVLADRIVVIEPVDHGTSLELQQFPYP